MIPATLGSMAGVKAQVTGMTAESKDFNDSMKSHAPLVFGFVLTMAFILLLVTFRSIVLPLTAIVLNLLSVGAAYGVLALVFQHTWAEGLLGFKSTGAVTSWLPLFLFVILFGLRWTITCSSSAGSARRYDRGMPHRGRDRARDQVDRRPGTSAAIVMVAVFAIFASLGALEFKQLGIGLGGGDPDRRDRRPRRAAASHDEAPGRRQLVPAQAACSGCRESRTSPRAHRCARPAASGRPSR